MRLFAEPLGLVSFLFFSFDNSDYQGNVQQDSDSDPGPDPENLIGLTEKENVSWKDLVNS